MITITKREEFPLDDKGTYVEMDCLSADIIDLPKDVRNGSKALINDTGDLYYLEGSTKTWKIFGEGV